MKFIPHSILTLILLSFALPQISFAQKPANVLEYYHLLKSDYFFCDAESDEGDSKEFRESALTVKNVRNGYLEAEPQDWYKLEIALFKEGGEDYLLVNLPCGPGCMCFWMDMYQFSDEEGLVEVNLLPDDFDEVVDDAEFVFVLPQFGTTVKLIEYDREDPKTLYELAWKNGRFEWAK